MTIKTETMMITPEIAARLIAKNSKNRPHNQRRSKALSEAMKRGEWEENGDTIRIAETGRLLDGQHRLWAIVKSGIAQRYIVVSGLKERVFDTIDRGSCRTVGDILSMRGEKNANVLAAAARLLVVYDKTGNPFHGNPEAQPTARESEEFVDSNPILRKIVNEFVRDKWIRRYVGAPLAAMCKFCFLQVDNESAEMFFDELSSGVVDGAGSPVLLLRDRLMENKASKEKVSKKYLAAITFKSYGYYVGKESRRFLRVREQGPGPELDLFSIQKLREKLPKTVKEPQ